MFAVGLEIDVLLKPNAGDQLYENDDAGGVEEQLPKRVLGLLDDVLGNDDAKPH